MTRVRKQEVRELAGGERTLLLPPDINKLPWDHELRSESLSKLM